SSLGTTGHEADAGDNEGDAEPAPESDVLVQEKLREQHHQDVAKRGGGKHVGQIGPGEGGEIACEEADEEENAEADPRVEQRSVQSWKIRQRDGAERAHSTGEGDVAAGGADDDNQEDEIFADGHKKWIEDSG